MSLKTKFLVFLSAVFIGLLVIILSTLSLVIYPSYEGLETREAKRNMGRVKNILEADINELDLFLFDWASWDATYNYVKDRNQAYIDDNFIPDYALSQNHDLYYIWDLKGQPIYHVALSEDGSSFMSFDEFPVEGLPENHIFLALKSLDSKLTGLIQTKQGPMIIAVRPIFEYAKKKNPIRGIFLMGRYLDKEPIESMAKRSQLKLNIWSLTGNLSKDIAREAPSNIKPGEIQIIQSEDENNIFVYASYPDIFGNPLLLLRASMPRDIVNQGKATITYGIWMALISGLAVLLILLIILQRSIVSPLSSLAKNIVRLGKRENVSQQLPVDRSDELGMVARSVIAGDSERNKAEFVNLCQNHVLEKLLNDDLLEEIFDGLIDLIEKQKPEMKCSVLLLGSDENNLFLISAPSLPKQYLNFIKEVPVGPVAGSCGTAVFRKETVVVADIANDPLWVDYKDIALSNGLKACWSMPLWGGGEKISGSFAIYYSEPRSPTQEEIELSDSLVNLIALAIDRKQIQQELEQYQRNLEAIIKQRTVELYSSNQNLKQEIVERIKTAKDLENSLEEKDVLLQEVNHRTKNNMQIISSLIHMQTKKIKDKKYLELFQESYERINSISLIQDKIFTQKNLQKIDAGNYFKSLVDELLVAYPRGNSGGISCEIETNQIILDVDMGINCGLIVNELLSNSLKHAFSNVNTGEITLTMSLNGQGKHVLIVRDNGLGIPKEIDLSNPKSTGLKLITQLAKKNLEGDISWDTTQGTCFKFTF
jgi:two-component sensor histidine kinase/sensor domain CHASE-containing protein